MKNDNTKKKWTGNKKNVNQDTSKTFMEMPVINLKAVGVDVMGSRSFFVFMAR